MSYRRFAVLVVGLAACGDDAGLPDARPPIDAPAPGKLTMSWALSHDGAPQTCASVGASQVTASIVPVEQPFGVVDSFSCASGMGTSRDLAPGEYNVSLVVAGAAGTLDGPVQYLHVRVEPGGTTAVEPAAAFDVEPTGSFTFHIGTSATGGNCADPAAMGAGITAVTLELRDAANSCVPTTFTIGAGATAPAGSYTSDCAGASYGCIAMDQEVRADGVIAGQHSMLLTGAVMGAPCWKRTSQFLTRAAGAVVALNPQTLSLDAQVPGCPAM